jgi:hypothetical protein
MQQHSANPAGHRPRPVPDPVPAVTVDSLAAVLEDRLITVQVKELLPGGACLGVPSRPRDLAVQLLTAIEPRITGNPPVHSAGPGI